MPEDHTPEDQFRAGPPPHLADQGPGEPNPQPPVDEEPVETRGIGWIIVPALLGALVGAVIGLVQATSPGQAKAAGSARELLLSGVLEWGPVGLIAGGAYGLLVWVFFPYKGRNPHAPGPEEEHKEAGTPPDKPDEHIM
jgi:hypothetical protein